MKRSFIISGSMLALAMWSANFAWAQFRTPPSSPISPSTPNGVIAPNPNSPLNPGNPSVIAPNPNSPINPLNPTGNTAFANGSAGLNLLNDQTQGANFSLGGMPFNSFSGLGGFPFSSGLGVGGFPWFAGGYGSYGGYGGSPMMAGNVNGLAQVIREKGEAAVLYENARDHSLDNAVRSNLLWFEMRDANDAYRQKQRNKYRHSNEALAKAAVDELPPRLAADDLDRVTTGRINWPAALLANEYAADRAALEEQFAMRASSGQPIDSTARIQAIVKSMGDELRLNIDRIPADDYMTARKFLGSLDLETHHHP